MSIAARMIGFAMVALACSSSAQEFHPDIPKVWDDNATKDFEVPLAQRDRSPRYMSAEEYYKLKVRPIYRTYPIYLQGQEPPGYLDSLKEKEPEIVFDPAKLHTKEDWIKAGKLVFEADVTYDPAPPAPGGRRVAPTLTKFVGKDGIIPSFVGGNYVIREKGVVERGSLSCASCHTRLMPDGTLLEGAHH